MSIDSFSIYRNQITHSSYITNIKIESELTQKNTSKNPLSIINYKILLETIRH